MQTVTGVWILDFGFRRRFLNSPQPAWAWVLVRAGGIFWLLMGEFPTIWRIDLDSGLRGREKGGCILVVDSTIFHVGKLGRSLFLNAFWKFHVVLG
jgi:hypothetical protein